MRSPSDLKAEPGDACPPASSSAVGQEDVDMTAAAFLLGSFRQQAQRIADPSLLTLAPPSLSLRLGSQPPDGSDTLRSPRYSFASGSLDLAGFEAAGRRPGSGSRSADPTTPHSHSFRTRPSKHHAQLSTVSNDSRESSEIKPSLQAEGSASQEEDAASPAWPVGREPLYPYSLQAEAIPTPPQPPRRKRGLSIEQTQAADSPSVPEAIPMRQPSSRKRSHPNHSLDTYMEADRSQEHSLRPRALFSADSGELGPTQVRASKAASMGRDSVPSSLLPSGAPRLRASRMTQTNSKLHPILQMGWAPLCEVHCNGLTGLFLGGHDRDLYIQATSKEFAALPPVDHGQGGCILSCSQFEKCAGRELSKKWKESIHVNGEGEGSKATLIAWLKRKAAHEFGEAAVGRQVWVCWCADAQFYRGTITHYNPDTGKHQVRYSDRFVEDLHLPVEVLSFTDVAPAVSPSLSSGQASPRCPAPAATLATATASEPEAYAVEACEAALPLLRGAGPLAGLKHAGPTSLIHQGSGVSVNSDYKLSPAEIEALKMAEDGNLPDLPGLVVAATLQQAEVAQPTQESPTSVHPRLLRHPHPPHATGLADSAGSDDSASRASEGGAPFSAPKRPRTGAVRGRPSAAVGSASWLQSLMPATSGVSEPLPRPPEDLTPPPAAMLKWLHAIALHLDEALSSPALTQPCQMAADLEDRPLSAAACFQALLAQALHPESHQGYFEAMAIRFHHFAHNADLQRLKLVEFVLAALQQSRQQLQQQQHLGRLSQQAPHTVAA